MSRRDQTSKRKRESSQQVRRVVPSTIEKSWRSWLLAAALVLLTLVTFWPVTSHDFVVFDDDQYVTANPSVQGGLTLDGLGWAFTTGHAANWHPLTWISHQLDVTLFGLDPRGHHLTSLLIHAANAALVLCALYLLSGQLWPSVLVAALFAVHPTRVESVAWVAERKDVLSTAFWMLALIAYARYVSLPSRLRFAWVGVFLAAGLMAKPMLVTLPFVLLLLDVWPLDRVRWKMGEGKASFANLVREKLPLFGLVTISSAVTFLVQRAGGAVGSIEKYSLPSRAGNALVAYVSYIEKLFWPRDLAVFYPHPGDSITAPQVATAAVVLAACSFVALRIRRRYPFVLVGWLWFVGTLVPVVGLVQVGWQASADRYSYVTFVGLFVIVAWGGSALVDRFPGAGRLPGFIAAVVVAGLAMFTRSELRHWRNSETLFTRAIAVTDDNYLARNNLGHYLNDQGRPEEARRQMEEAIRIKPRYAEAHTNLGRSLFFLGQLEAAAQEFHRALEIEPDDAVAMNNLGFTYLGLGEIERADFWYGMAAVRQPDWAEVQYRLGIVRMMRGRFADGAGSLRAASSSEPTNADYAAWARGAVELPRSQGEWTPDGRRLASFLAASHREAGVAQRRRGLGAGAFDQMRRALWLVPDHPDVLADLGAWAAEERRVAEARTYLERALVVDPDHAIAHNNLGHLLFTTGEIPSSIQHFEAALRRQPDFELAASNLARARDSLLAKAR